MTQPKLIRVLVDDRPVMQVTPSFADALCFDLGFANTTDLSLVIFPTFNHRKYGTTGSGIALRRWMANGFALAPIDVAWDDVDLDAMSFTTFRHGAGLLLPTPLSNFLQDPDYEFRISDWRKL